MKWNGISSVAAAVNGALKMGLFVVIPFWDSVGGGCALEGDKIQFGWL